MKSPAYLTSLVLLSVLASASFASPSSQNILSSDQHELQAADRAAYYTELLAAHDNDPVRAMWTADSAYAATLDEPRLIEVFGAERRWMTEGDKLRLKQAGLSFMDMTNFEDVEVGQSFVTAEKSWPEIQRQDKVNKVISLLSADAMRADLTTLTSFYNRFYRSDYGIKSSRWILDQVLQITGSAPPSTRLSIEAFTHSFPQSSIIARFEPSGGRTSPSPKHPRDVLPRIILGAHQDSSNYKFPMLPAPGADDDGSGTVTILAAFRALVEAGFTPAAPVEFHWYAAEEGGLLGSQEVVKEYVALEKKVGAMIQFDMTAYVDPRAKPGVTLMTTDVHPSLTNWTLSLVPEYCSLPQKEGKLWPNAGSDHMSWHRAGFPAVFAAEGDPEKGEFDPWVHTVNDTMYLDEFSFEHALEFAKLAVGFAVELGGWTD